MSPEKNEIPEIKENNAAEPLENKINNAAADENEQNEFNDYYYDEDFESTDENETEQPKKENKASKIFLYIIYAIVIVLCLVIIARNLFFKNNDKSSNNTSSAASSEAAAKNAPKKIMDLYVLADLPEGYELINQDITDTKAVSTYKKNKVEIALTQSTIKDYEPEYDITDSDIDVSDFHSGAGQSYTAYQIDGKCYIVWTTDEYTFEIKTSLKKSESIPFIFNVQKAEDSSSSESV